MVRWRDDDAEMRTVLFAAMIGVLAGAGCDGHENGAPVDADGVDAPTQTCADGLTSCDGSCTDTLWNPLNCGACGVGCVGDTSSCGAGRCVAPEATIWERHYGNGSVRSVAVDQAGNTYLAGTFDGTIDLGGGPLASAGAADIVIASFSPTGQHRWSKRIGGPGPDDVGELVVVHGDDHGELAIGDRVYVVGGFTDTADFAGDVRTSAGDLDAFALVLSAVNAASRGVYTFGTFGDDYARAVVADTDGNFTVAGTFAAGTLALGGGHELSGTAGGNAFIASFTSDGTHRWSRTVAGSGGPGVANAIHSLAIDRAGNVTAGGEFWGMTEFGAVSVPNPNLVTGDAFVASYTESGDFRWARTFGSPGSERALAVAADADGNVVAGGIFDGTVAFGTTTLTATGFGLGDGWVAILGADDGSTHLARAIDGELTTIVHDVAVDPAGNPLVAAEVQGRLDLGAGPIAPAGGRIALARLDPLTGSPLFAVRHGIGPVGGAWSVAVSSHGAIAAAGTVSRNGDLGLGPIVGPDSQYGFVMMLAP